MLQSRKKIFQKCKVSIKKKQQIIHLTQKVPHPNQGIKTEAHQREKSANRHLQNQLRNGKCTKYANSPSLKEQLQNGDMKISKGCSKR